MPLHSVTEGNWRGKATKAHVFKIIYAPVFVDLKYIYGFQNSASIMKQRTETSFLESQVSDLPRSPARQACTFRVCWCRAAPQSPTALVSARCSGKPGDFLTRRGFRVLGIKSCGEEDSHHNRKQAKESSSKSSRCATLLPEKLHRGTVSGRTVNGGLVPADSSGLLLRLPARITAKSACGAG